MENRIGAPGAGQLPELPEDDTGQIINAEGVSTGRQVESSQQPSAPPTLETPAGETEEPVESNIQTLLGELHLDGQMRESEIRGMLPPDEGALPLSLFSDSVAKAQTAPVPGRLQLMALKIKLEDAKIPPKLRDEFMALAAKQKGIDMRIILHNAEIALKSSDPAAALKSVILETRADNYFESFNATYNINGVEVQATPHFRITNGWSGPPGRTSSAAVQDDLNALIGKRDKANYNQAMKIAIHGVAYGRATPEQVKMVTEALIRSGQYKVSEKMHPGLSESETIRMMQWDHGVGIDCAGYVQQAFLAVHGGTRDDYGLKSFGNEDLMSLKTNKHFAQVKPQDVRAGDLIALDKPPGESVGHTVLVHDHHVMDAAEIKKFQDPDGFGKPGDKIHIYHVDASFGGGEEGDHGGLVRKTWMYNERTGQWAEAAPNDTGGEKLQISQTNGPYNHPMNGIYRPKGE